MTSSIKVLQNLINNCVLNVSSKSNAFDVAYDLIGEPFELNKVLSERAGYSIYSCESGTYICDLNTRLEINFSNSLTKNIWIDENEY